MEIVPFSPEFQSAVSALNASVQAEYTQQFSDAASKTMTELSRSSNERYWVALENEEAAGTIGIALLESNRAVIKRMVVAKAYRGKEKGISDQLLDTAITFAKENKISTIYLGTMSQFRAAQKFYLKRDFVVIGRSMIPSDYVFNPVDTVFFKRTI
jgi:N-acetylglutamate synthase-like GNAT family acetyltransferase